MDSETLSHISIPLFTGAIGYVIGWTGVWMPFNPAHFKGFRLAGLAPLARVLPRKLQTIRDQRPGRFAPFTPREQALAGDIGYLYCLTWPPPTELRAADLRQRPTDRGAGAGRLR